ncbi:MAG: hypothetical protein LJE92_20265, partial [Gammaproteobacteria bacterium]|nr:hypothetical protein [Gammaproteobacteria bacterium]
MKRRDFLTLSIKYAIASGYASTIPASLLYSQHARADVLEEGLGLSDPLHQDLFVNNAPNALADSFKYRIRDDRVKIYAAQTIQNTGLLSDTGVPVPTTVWGYGTSPDSVSWPGMTLERRVKDDPLKIMWRNALVDGSGNPLPHLLPVDENLHWAYSLPGYEDNSIGTNGVPLVPHVHGGANISEYDGNPEYFFSPGSGVTGPRYVSDNYIYGGRNWNDEAGMLWYHDHALGITRLNVYAGLAGFFVLRDENDTGRMDNPAGLPAGPYELGFAVQDRAFLNTGELFYPAFPGDPAYADFITGEGAELDPDLFPGVGIIKIDPETGGEYTSGGPTALAEFFGDHMLVNGVLWPKYDVEARQYRVRLLNGSDSRFMRLRLRVVPLNETDPAAGKTLPFYIVGSDQSLRRKAARRRNVDFIPGERLDLVIDFSEVDFESRVIIENRLGDAPFGGEFPVDDDDLFANRRTDRIMAFDVVLNTDKSIRDSKIDDDC